MCVLCELSDLCIFRIYILLYISVILSYLSGVQCIHMYNYVHVCAGKKSNVGAIAGGVVGGVLVIALIILATGALFWKLS